MTDVGMNGFIIDDTALDGDGLGGTPFRGTLRYVLPC